jgi:uncharacterized protein YbjT (DUF2867 family)
MSISNNSVAAAVTTKGVLGMDKKILVTGATGRQGGAILRHLLRYGQSVRALTRHPQGAEDLIALGVEVVEGDLTDKLSIEKALDGITKMFLVTTPYEAGVEAEIRQGFDGADAAKAAGVEHLVYSSVGSAHRHTGIPHFDSKWKIEQHIRELGLNATILRPVFFMDNFENPLMIASLRKGILALPIRANRKLAMIAVDDIGEFGAQAFLHPEKFVGEGIELAGDELTFPEAMARLTQIAGKAVSYQVLPREGSDKLFGREAALMYKWFDEVGYNPDIAGLLKKYGVNLMKFTDYLTSAQWVSQLKTPAPTPAK